METESVKKKSKLAEAEALIEASQKLVKKVDSDVRVCRVSTFESASKFDEVKRTFKNTILKNADSLLEKVGFEYITYEEGENFELSIDGDSEPSVSVKNLSSGRFTGFMLAMLVALLTVALWGYLAMNQMNVDIHSLTPETALSQLNPTLEWIGGLVGGTMSIGALILGLSVLLIAGSVYALRMSLKGKKNLVMAQDSFEKSNAYWVAQEASQREMKKIDNQLKEATTEIKNLETILNEQIAVLKRVIHVEGVYEDEKEYHPTSKKMMRETEKIMRAAESLLETAITQEGKLNFQSVQALNSAKDIYTEYLSRIYD